LRSVDIILRALFGPAAEQDDQRLAVAAKIDPIAWPEIDASLEHAAADTFHV
jgi:hypothetical protein